MRVLVVYAHPLADSLNGTLHGTILEALREAGHEADDLDLYADGFDPVLTAEERQGYFDIEANRARFRDYAERIEAARGLVFCFPTWCLGPPAILKGFFDRVMAPGIAFRMKDDGALGPNLEHVGRVASVVTYGRRRMDFLWFGDPSRRMMTRYMSWFVAPGARISYLGLYGLQKRQAPSVTKFIGKVRREMTRF